MATAIQLLKAILLPLVVTILIESIPLCVLKPRAKWLSVGLLCNVLTNPLLNCLRILLYSLYPNMMVLWVFTLMAEILVVLGESWFYKALLQVSRKKSLLVSLICNTISFGIGAILL